MSRTCDELSRRPKSPALALATPPQTLREQFGNPTGVVGWLVGQLMAVKNARRSAWVHDQLALTGSERLLEIGFASGVDLVRVGRRVGSLAGVDHSSTMLGMATRRLARAGLAADLRLGSACELPFEDLSFDRVVAINVVQFWEDLVYGMCEVRRVLAPDGRAVIAIQPQNAGATAETARDWADRLGHAMRVVGFAHVELRRFERTAVPTVCAIGTV